MEKRDDAGTLPLAEKSAHTKDRFGERGVIGEGGQAVVRKVRDLTLDRELAMKVMKQKQDAGRFVDEARITAQLDHPHVPSVHELGVDDDGAHYFTMKLVEGRTLAEMLAPPFRPTNDEDLFQAMQVLIKVCEAVGYAHSKGVVHCDLKPANVMVGPHGQIYVMDWGIARRIDPEDGAATDGRILGTIGYMSPEQAKGWNDKLDARTDIYALGAMLYRIVVGFPPYHAQSADTALGLAKDGTVFPPEQQARGQPMSRRLLEIAMKALSREPNLRHQTVEAFQRDLELYLRGSRRFPERVYDPGDTVVREGEPANEAFVILQGSLEASRLVDGVPRRLRVMGVGELFGESAILHGQPRTATVVALEHTRVSVLSKELLDEEMGRADVLSLALTSVLERFWALETSKGPGA